MLGYRDGDRIRDYRKDTCMLSPQKSNKQHKNNKLSQKNQALHEVKNCCKIKRVFPFIFVLFCAGNVELK